MKDMALQKTVSDFLGAYHPLVYFAMNYRCYDNSESESGSVGLIGFHNVVANTASFAKE